MWLFSEHIMHVRAKPSHAAPLARLDLHFAKDF